MVPVAKSSAAKMIPVPGTHFLSLVRVYHKDKQGVLHSLQDYDLTKGVLLAISRGERSISTRFFSAGDRKRLKQIGLEKENEVDLVVEFPWDGRSLLAVVTKANNTQLRRLVLAMAVDRIRKTASLKRILEFKSLEGCTIRENPYLGPGHPPYENFIESLVKITDTSIPAGEELLELFLKSAADDADKTTLTCVEKRGIRTVFHGTNHDVMDAILKSGLDPNRRRPDLRDDYFGIDYTQSIRYSREKTTPSATSYCTKLLVFLIILDPQVNRWSWGADIVESNTCQLPLAEITLRREHTEGWSDEELQDCGEDFGDEWGEGLDL